MLREGGGRGQKRIRGIFPLFLAPKVGEGGRRPKLGRGPYPPSPPFCTPLPAYTLNLYSLAAAFAARSATAAIFFCLDANLI